MRAGYVPYMTLWDETEVVHTCSENIEDIVTEWQGHFGEVRFKK